MVCDEIIHLRLPPSYPCRITLIWSFYLPHPFQNCSGSLNSVLRRCDNKIYFSRQAAASLGPFMRQTSGGEEVIQFRSIFFQYQFSPTFYYQKKIAPTFVFVKNLNFILNLNSSISLFISIDMVPFVISLPFYNKLAG